MAKKSLEEKVKEFAPELVDLAPGLDATELRKAIAERAMLFSASKEAEKADSDLKQAKDEVKELRAPYAEDQKAAQLAITYLAQQLEDRGGGNDLASAVNRIRALGESMGPGGSLSISGGGKTVTIAGKAQ